MAKGRENLTHIGIFGRTNTGKSTLINVLSGQETAIVSPIPGTTTDPVKKSIEIIGLGNVVLIDTAGIDDISKLGAQRVSKTLQTLDLIDIAILVIADNIFGESEINLIDKFIENEIPYLIVANKTDIVKVDLKIKDLVSNQFEKDIISVSSLLEENISHLIDKLISCKRESAYQNTSLLSGIVKHGDLVLLVTPIDSEAPEGRLILPQVNLIRNSLDSGCITIVVRDSELEEFLNSYQLKPRIVITDSQVFGKVSKIVPDDILLTGFSVLLARQKGDFDEYIKGTPKIDNLKDGDRVLLLESCTHTSSCEDIGRVKIPAWLRKYTGKKLEFDVVAGLDSLNRDIHDYSLVIQCGGCVITRRQLINRLKKAKDAGIPISNYGLAIAYMNGIFERAVKPFNLNELG